MIARPHVLTCTALVLSCASDVERTTRRELQQVERELATLEKASSGPEGEAEPTPEVEIDGTLPRYIAYAYAHNPSLRASFEQWRAATHVPAQKRRLPEPVVSYAFFIRSVETRVGPQRHKLGVSQWFPWPSRLTRAGKAAALQARSAQRQFEAHALEIARSVSVAYWQLWRIERIEKVDRDRLSLLGSMSDAVRARMEVGQANLSDLTQIDLLRARTSDHLAGLKEARARASARLVQALGAPPGTDTPVVDAGPELTLPAASEAELQARAADHPRVEAMAHLAEAAGEQEKAARGARAPSFGLGVDWILVGESQNPMVADSGKDAVVAMAMAKIPLWQPSYGAAEKEARARQASFRARKVAAEQAAASAVSQRLADLRDAARRVELYDTTLVPQAETAWGSAQTSYQAGRGAVADILLAERALLEIQQERIDAETAFGIAWADLESAVGVPVHPEGADK